MDTHTHTQRERERDSENEAFRAVIIQTFITALIGLLWLLGLRQLRITERERERKKEKRETCVPFADLMSSISSLSIHIYIYKDYH